MLPSDIIETINRNYAEINNLEDKEMKSGNCVKKLSLEWKFNYNSSITECEEDCT